MDMADNYYLGQGIMEYCYAFFMINLVKQIELVTCQFSGYIKQSQRINKQKIKPCFRSILPAGKVQQRNRQSYQRH